MHTNLLDGHNSFVTLESEEVQVDNIKRGHFVMSPAQKTDLGSEATVGFQPTPAVFNMD